MVYKPLTVKYWRPFEFDFAHAYTNGWPANIHFSQVPDRAAWQKLPHPKLIDKLANVPKPIKRVSKCWHWGNWWSILARPGSSAAKLGSNSQSLWVNQEWGRVNDKWDEGGWVRKGKERQEVAFGFFIESRSCLSWWSGKDERDGMESRVRGDYKASGSLVHPVGWPRVLALLAFLFSFSPSVFHSCSFPRFSLPSHISPQRSQREARLSGSLQDVWRLVSTSFQSTMSSK